MQLLSVGEDQFINMDLVTNIKVHMDGSVVLFFAAPGGNHIHMLTIEGRDAQNLLAWLQQEATPTTPKDLKAKGANLGLHRR